jgi:hypothetical protein
MSEHEFRLEIWRHIAGIVKALYRYWFGKKIIIGHEPE